MIVNFTQDPAKCMANGNKLESLASVLWGGIIEGCDCTNGVGVHKGDLIKRKCSGIELDNG